MQTIFSIEDYQYLADEILEISNFETGIINRTVFPDGEIYHQIVTEVKDKRVMLIGGTINDKSTLELLDIAMGLIGQGAHELNIIIPYFGYATMERAVLKGEIVKAKTRANLFSSLSNPSTHVKIFLVDLHSEGIPYYFSQDMFTTHIYGKKMVIDICQSISDDFVLAATDAGRAKWVESLANEMHVKSAFLFKHRVSGTETYITGMNADVRGKIVVIYDDMIRTGGSLMQAASAYHDSGASEVYAITTHGLFNNNALEKIAKQNIIKQVYSSNSHPNAKLFANQYLTIKSIAGIIFDTVEL